MLIWAINFPLAVAILKTWDALALAPVRMVLAGLTVLCFALLFRQSKDLLETLRNRRFVLASVLFGVSAMFFMYAQAKVDAVSASVVVSSLPLFSAMFGWWAGTEKPGWRLLFAILLTVAGGVLTAVVSAQGSGSEGSFVGLASMLAGVIFYVWYSREMVVRFASWPDLAKTASSMLLAAIPCLGVVAVVIIAGGSLRHDLSATSLAQVAFLACVTIGASSVLWLWTGRAVGVTVAGMHHNMVPFYVIMLGTFSGSVITFNHVVGALLVVAGAVLAQLRPRSIVVGVTQPVVAGRAPWAPPRRRPSE